MIMTGETVNHNNQIEMTSDVSTITQDLTSQIEAEKTISTESKFGFFDRQMAELEPKVCFMMRLMHKLLLKCLNLIC